MLEPIWLTPSGQILQVSESSIVNFQLNFSNPSVDPITIQLISGSLPSGLSIGNNGLISGTVDNIILSDQSSFAFVLRLSSVNGFSDRSFEIVITNVSPSWLDNQNFGDWIINSYFEYQFSIIDIGGDYVRFQKIRGRIPDGLYLDKNGYLSGIISVIDQPLTYEFTIRAYLDIQDETIFIDREFSINVILVGNRKPIWSTPSGLIGDISDSQPYSFQLSAGDADQDALSFSAIGLPPGLIISSTGLISGQLTDPDPIIYTFVATVSDGMSSVSRTFQLNANILEIFPIIWITPPGRIGEICEGEKSLFRVEATSQSRSLRYEIITGQLPGGLTIDVNTGEIWGKPFEQGFDTEYYFEVRVSNTTEEIFRNFSILVKDCLEPGSQKINFELTGDLRDQYYELYINKFISYDTWFRQGDREYGLVRSPEILIIENLNNTVFDLIYEECRQLLPSYLIFGKVESAKALVNGQHVYDVIYRRVYDAQSGSLKEFFDISSLMTITPGALSHVRTRLLETFGSSGNQDRLPVWMTCEQIVGDQSSTLGWIPALPIAYLKPGQGQRVADLMNQHSQSAEQLYQMKIIADRIFIEPTAQQITEKTQLLFTNIHDN